MSCASCSNNSTNYTINSVSNSDTTNTAGASCGCQTAANCQCRLAVTVENDFAPCSIQQEYFDVTVTNRSGETVASGKIAGGSSAIFTLPAEGEYAVTVTGGICASPRAQTRRVRCCCGAANGVTFIFMKLDQDCVHKPPHHCCCCPPVPRPPMPPCPPRPPHDHPCGGIDPHSVTSIDPHSVTIFTENGIQ